MIAILLMAAAPQAAIAPAPSAEAEALGRRLAGTGLLAALLPLVTAKDTEDLLAEHPELSDAEKAELRATARAQVARGTETLMTAEGHAYAAALGVEDLRTLVAAGESDAAKRQRAAMPRVLMTTMGAASGFDFKARTLAAFCAKTGKACPAK